MTVASAHPDHASRVAASSARRPRDLEILRCRLMILPAALIERIDAGSVIIWNPQTGSRLQVARPAYELLRRFDRPIHVYDVVARDDRWERTVQCIRTLVSKGFLVPSSNGIARLRKAAEP